MSDGQEQRFPLSPGSEIRAAEQHLRVREAFDHWFGGITLEKLHEYTHQGRALLAFSAGWEAAGPWENITPVTPEESAVPVVRDHYVINVDPNGWPTEYAPDGPFTSEEAWRLASSIPTAGQRRYLVVRAAGQPA